MDLTSPSGRRPPPPTPRRGRIGGVWCTSILDLFQRAADAATTGSEEQLRRLRIDEGEYTSLLWPQFPPAGREPLSLRTEIWRNVDARCRRVEANICERLEGRHWEIVDVTVPRCTDIYITFSIHRGISVRFRSDTDFHPILVGSVV